MKGIASQDLSGVRSIQNPALGAYLLWSFGIGFRAQDSLDAPIHLAFLVLPILLHEATSEEVKRTFRSSGLALFVAKFDKSREMLMEIHDRALKLRNLSVESIGVAEASRLVRIDYSAAMMRAYPVELLGHKAPKFPERIKHLPASAEKLGFWFSALPSHQIAASLRIDF